MRRAAARESMESLLRRVARTSPPPLLSWASAWIAGDAVAVLDDRALIAVLWLALGSLAAWWWRSWVLIVAGLAFLLGLARADLVYRPYVAPDDIAGLDLPAEVLVEGEVDAPVEYREAGARLWLAVRRVRQGGVWRDMHGRVALSLAETSRAWDVGDGLRGSLRLRRPRNFGNPGEFDYRALLARRGVYVTAFSFDDRRLRRRAAEDPGRLVRWRRQVGALFTREAPPLPSAILRALIIGTAHELPESLREAFVRAGVSHVLSISGLHVGLVAASAMLAWRWLLARSTRLLLTGTVPKWAVALSLVPVLAYAGIAGANHATRRAVWMSVMVLGAVLLDRLENLYVALAAAALVVLVVAPGASQEISFQLSFAAVLGLLLAAERLRRWWPGWAEERLLALQPRRARFEYLALQFAVVTVSATAFTAPLVAFHFNSFSVAAPLGNLVVTPLLGSVVVGLGLAAASLAPWFDLGAAACVWLATPVIDVSLWLVEAIAAWPWSSVRLTTPGWAELAVVYVGLLAVLLLRGGRRWWAAGACLVLLGAEHVRRGELARPAGQLRVTFLSVGQGDCAVIETPGGPVVVVDGGGLRSPSFDVGERLVAPYLWWRGHRAVEVLVVSHPQWDHYGGLAFVADTMQPAAFWSSGATAEARGYARLLAALRRAGAAAVEVRDGFEQTIGGVRLRALAPPVPPIALGVNDASVVLAVEYAGRRILLTGDIEAAGEARLLAAALGALRSDVIKVPHHGSSTSSGTSLVRQVRPRLAVVSAGWGNRFGFPKPEVVRRWRAGGAEVLRTDVHGAVVVWVAADGRWGYAPTVAAN